MYTSTTNEINAGRFKLPTWVANQADETWGTIPASNTLAAIDPANDPSLNGNHPSTPKWRAIGGQHNIISSWCGALYDYDNDELVIPGQGGHNDYAGNEPYRLAINNEVPEWDMVRPPSGSLPDEITLNDNQEATGLHSDGRLRSVHGYNASLYVPNEGWCLAALTAVYITGNDNIKRPSFINPATGELDRQGALVSVTGTAAGLGACYDPSRHRVWVRWSATGYFSSYDIATDTWYQHGSLFAANTYCALEYIPEHDCILWFNSVFASGFAIFDCATNTLHQPSVTGSTTGLGAIGQSQPRKVSANKFLMWNNSSNTTDIYTLSFTSNPRTDVWEYNQLPVASENSVTPTVATSNGTYGRFFYSPKLGICGVINSVSQPVYFYKIGEL